jgi:hypothetical protein
MLSASVPHAGKPPPTPHAGARSRRGLTKGVAGLQPGPVPSTLFEKSASQVDPESMSTVSAATTDSGAASGRREMSRPEFTPTSPSETCVPDARISVLANST